MEAKDNIIIKLTFQFALEIIKYCEGLQEDKKFVIANQLLKSGTSIGASTANSIGNLFNTSLLKPFTISAMAFSVGIPR